MGKPRHRRVYTTRLIEVEQESLVERNERGVQGNAGPAVSLQIGTLMCFNMALHEMCTKTGDRETEPMTVSV